MKIFKSSLVVLAVALLIFGFVKLPRHSAQAQSNSAPVIGIQAAQSRGSNCTVKQTNQSYSQFFQNNSNPNPTGSDSTPTNDSFAGSADYDGNPYGDTDCAKVYLSGQGPFTQDFQIGVRMQNPKASGGWGPWGWTSWASDLAQTGTSASSWSPWIGAIQNVGSDPGHAMYQVAVNTRPLPAAGDTISITKVGLQEKDGHHDSAPPTYCGGSDSGGEFEQVFTSGAADANGEENGWSSSVSSNALGGSSRGDGWSAVGDVADCTRLYLGGATIIGAIETANNIPTAFSASQTMATGTDGNSLSITMKNTGTTSWIPTFNSTDKDGTQSGNCTYAYQSSNGVLNAPKSGSAASSCSVITDLVSTDYFLAHTASSFSMSPERIPITYTGAQKTIAYTPAHTVTVPVPCGTSLKSDRHNLFSFINTVFALTVPPGGQCTATKDVPESWTISYNVPGSIAPGQSVVFPMASITAPSKGGVYDETWQMQYSGKSFGALFTKTINVTQSAASPSNQGTWNVSSTNIVTGGPVIGSWTVFGPTNESSQNVVSASYSDLSFGTYTTIPGTADGYALKAVEEPAIARANNGGNVFTKTLAAIHNAFTSMAFADSNSVSAGVCMPSDYSLSGGMYTCANGQGWDSSQTLTATAPTAESIIMWYPIAAMNIASSKVALDGSGNGTITVQNTGKPGSELDWTANTTNTWFTLPSASGSIVNNASQQDSSGATQNIAISANSGLAPGNYTGTVQVVGTSKYCPAGGCNPSIPPYKITVTLTVPPPPVTVSSASCAITPTSVRIGDTANAACTVTMSDGSTNNSCNFSSDDSSIAAVNSGTGVVTGVKPGTANIVGTASADSSKSCKAGVTVTNYVASVSASVSPSWLVITGTGGAVTAQAKGTVTMADGSTNNDVTYSSDNGGVASVDAASGLVTAHAVGGANIKATSNQDPSIFSSVGITVATTPCTGSGCGGCSGSGCPPVTPPGGGGGTTVTGVTVTANPTSIKPSGTATCTATVTGTGSYSSAISWSATNGAISGSGSTVTLVPSGASTATCKATSQEDPSKSGSATVTVQTGGGGSGVNLPSCSMTANPTSVVVPAASTLSYSCVNVNLNACSLSGGQFGTSSPISFGGSSVAKGTANVSPTANTIYGISCQGSQSSASANASVQVTVTNPGRIETSTLY